jgi:hypothetical protein
MAKMLLILVAPFVLSGCVAQLAADVITAPIKIVSKTADILTTSQSESDQNRGRKLREREQELGKLARKRDKQSSKCDKGDQDACEKANDIDVEIDEIESRKI